MSCFLYDYSFSIRDAYISLLTGFSGLPYSTRHWKSGGMVNRAVSVLEAFPLFGGLFSLADRISFYVYEHGLDWQGKLERNALKALKDHNLEMTIEEVSEKDQKIEFISFSLASHKGKRKMMEDSHFYKKIEEGHLMAIFDGHGGSEVAEYLNLQFQVRFSRTLDRFKGNIYLAFTNLLKEIDIEIGQYSEWNDKGSTAVISFVDDKTWMVYTATLADSEAFIYRKGCDGSYFPIPLSCLRNWSYLKEEERIINYYQRESLLWERLSPKGRLMNLKRNAAVNVSRAIGDHDFDKQCLIAKPKISSRQLKKGDRLVLACDGLWDYVDFKELSHLLVLSYKNS